MEIYPHKPEKQAKTPMGDPMEKNKKIIAAVSAVLLYLQEEEELKFVCMQKFPQPQSPTLSHVPAMPGVSRQWAISGRYDQMHRRTMMQMKAFHR
jgi:hypothetical protein